MKTAFDLKNGQLSVIVVSKHGKRIATIGHFWSNKSYAVTTTIKDVNGAIMHNYKAGGGGYDKQTAGLAGAVIDGITLHNHCERATEWNGKSKKPPQGAKFANYNPTKKHYEDCYYESGLDILKSFGYTIEQIV